MTEPLPSHVSSAIPDYSATGRGAAPAPVLHTAPDDVRLETATAQTGMPVPRRTSAGLVVASVIGFILVALSLLFVLAYLFV